MGGSRTRAGTHPLARYVSRTATSRKSFPPKTRLPTLVAAAGGNPNLGEKVATKGVQAGEKHFKVHLDGYNHLPYLTGQSPTSARHEYVYFSDDGDLLAYRDDRYKYHYEVQLATGMAVWRMPLTSVRAPIMIDLKSDPYEYSWDASAYWEKFAIEHAFLLLPAVEKVANYLSTC